MKIKFKKTTDLAIVPTRGSEFAAGYDLYSVDNAGIMPGHTSVVGTGLCMEIPKGYFGAVFARSGLATKQGLRPSNCVGVVDCDYRGEVKVPVYNDSDLPQVVSVGDRVAQLIVLPYQELDFVEAELKETARSSGGFGSTGVNICKKQ